MSSTPPLTNPPLGPAPPVTSLPIPSPDEWKGVGGWLAFFAFALVVVGGLGLIGYVRGLVSALVRVHDEFPAVQFSVVAYLLNCVAWMLVRSYGVFAGIQLWRIRHGVVETAKRFLVLTGSLAAIKFAWTLGSWILDARGQLTVVIAAQADTFRSTAFPYLTTICFALIWYAYLTRSARVRFTYREPEVRS